MNHKIQIALATESSKGTIDHIRHNVYATELGQFSTNADETLHDQTDIKSTYLIALEEEKLIGFVGITSPDSASYSIERYLPRAELSLNFKDSVYEIRALTVVDESRGTQVAGALMYAAFRWIQAHGGTQLVAMGHRTVKDMYIRLGLRPIGKSFVCGELEYEPLAASVEQVEQELTRFESRLNRLEQQLIWNLDIPFRQHSACYHGGAFFSAIGDTFEHLERRNEIINADVLDAWFPPCIEAQRALHEQLGWLMRTSPPNHAEGLTQTIAEVRGVDPSNILTGGGSSPLIFLAFRHWLTPSSRVLLLNPTYGEYAHVLEKVVGCHIERFKLNREDGYEINRELFTAKLKEGFDLVVWVNPNSPTGRHMARSDVELVLQNIPSSTKVWIDETYIEYAPKGQSMEQVAAQTEKVIVVKSMSKVYGLSGLRVGYLCGSSRLLDPLRGLTPPWSVSLPAQVAAIKALQSTDYYQACYKETHRLRSVFIECLRMIGITEIIPGTANFVLIHLPENGPDGATTISECQKQGLFIRDASEMGAGMGDRAIRIAIKDAHTNQRMLGILNSVLQIATPEEVGYE